MKLHELVIQIKTKNDFIEFARALAIDLAANRDTWENPTLESYLEAIARWVEDSDGFYRNQGRAVPIDPSWQNLAEILIAAKMYE